MFSDMISEAVQNVILRCNCNQRCIAEPELGIRKFTVEQGSPFFSTFRLVFR